jgi:hypothetical protein
LFPDSARLGLGWQRTKGEIPSVMIFCALSPVTWAKRGFPVDFAFAVIHGVRRETPAVGARIGSPEVGAVDADGCS